MRRMLYAVATLAFLFGVSVPAEAGWNFEQALQKYRERFPTGGNGTVGTVKIQARLLYGKDGTTQLDVTTGSFDTNAAPTGQFVRIKLAALNASGREVFSYYYYPLGQTTFSQKIKNLAPGMNFAVEAYAFPDWRSLLWTTQVRVTTRVQKRADLYAERIDSPLRLPVGLPVQIIGVVSELNGQIGARSNCVLYANGLEVDRSANIWVDSGDTVSCAFSPMLNTIGINTLRLAVESVTPGDWDTANNAVEKQVEVMELTPAYDGAAVEALSVDIDNTTYNQYGRFLNSTFTGGYDFVKQDTVDRNSDAFVYSAAAVQINEVPSAVMVTATDGLVTWSIDRAVPNCFDYQVGQAGGRTFYTYVTGCGNLYVEVGSFAGTVTYASRLLVQTFTGRGATLVYDGPAQYIYNNQTTEIHDGDKLFHGDVWTVDVAVTAGPYVFSTPVTVILDQHFDSGETTPATCTTTSNSLTCTSSSWRIAGRSGSATVLRQP